MQEKKFKIILLGAQGSGKGTQAEFLVDKLGIPLISVGKLLRDEIAAKTEIGNQIEDYMKKGQLVPNSIAHELAKQKLDKSECKDGFVFDGFPRNRIQAKFLETITDITDVLEIYISDDEAVKRLSGRRTCAKCGDIYHLEFNPPKKEGVCDECGGELIIRDDDTEEAIRQRLKIYHEETEEVVEYFKEKGILKRVNGEQSIEKVKEEIFRGLGIEE